MSQKTAIVILIAVFLACCFFVRMLVSPRFSSTHIITECTSVANKALCYRDRINDVLVHRGIAVSFDVLAAVYDADPGFAGMCHAETHELGKAAYAQFHRTGKVGLSSKASYCGYGFYHGFMEALLGEISDLSEARAFCKYAGTQVSTPPDYAEGACYHGIGHGVTDGYDPTLWGDARRMAAPGLALCGKLASAQDEWKRRCASGVFNSIAVLHRDPKYKLTTDNPFTLCNASYTTLEKEACYDQMNTLATFMAEGNLSNSMAYTEKIVDTKYRRIAVKGIAAFYVQVLKSAKKTVSPKEASEVCGVLDLPFRDECIKGLADGIMEFGTPGAQYQEILALCRALDFSVDLQSACFSRLYKLSEIFYSENKVRMICREIPEQHQGAECRSLLSFT